jgi:NAD(P)-dependent dehydrogenase (short-subunit alcohol dehydrogenase family)
MDIQGLAAIVTGGASGLGAATAEMLAARGAKVTIFDLNTELGVAKARELGGHFASVNVTDEEAVGHALREAEGLHGKARILVNCAGIGPPGKVISREGTVLPLADFAKIITINLIGSFNVLSQFAGRSMMPIR